MVRWRLAVVLAVDDENRGPNPGCGGNGADRSDLERRLLLGNLEGVFDVPSASEEGSAFTGHRSQV
jgi:hypothetical protein